ncbi:WS/DGAT domain-containing protein [Mycobacterium uberis]|uniref:WS/DGAT domain-containing protein n=1 Tax=Mycobacterium uberis TaxID=2162698 RepID=UPI000E304498|nr:WS/DGAT domain-containing protein [Mycobacterium uberis]
MGQLVERVLPITPTALKYLSIAVTLPSYGNELVFGITTDYDAASDITRLTAGLELEVAQLTAFSHDSVLLFTKKDLRVPSSGVLPSKASCRRAVTPSTGARR